MQQKLPDLLVGFKIFGTTVGVKIYMIYELPGLILYKIDLHVWHPHFPHFPHPPSSIFTPQLEQHDLQPHLAGMLKAGAPHQQASKQPPCGLRRILGEAREVQCSVTHLRFAVLAARKPSMAEQLVSEPSPLSACVLGKWHRGTSLGNGQVKDCPHPNIRK